MINLAFKEILPNKKADLIINRSLFFQYLIKFHQIYFINLKDLIKEKFKAELILDHLKFRIKHCNLEFRNKLLDQQKQQFDASLLKWLCLWFLRSQEVVTKIQGVYSPILLINGK